MSAWDVLATALLTWTQEHQDCDDLCTHKAEERADAERGASAFISALADEGYYISTSGRP